MSGGLHHVNLVQGKVFSQNRQLDGRARCRQIVDRALEKIEIGKDAQRRRATRGINTRDGRRMESFYQDTPAGRRFLDLGDNRRRRRCQRRTKIPRASASLRSLPLYLRVAAAQCSPCSSTRLFSTMRARMSGTTTGMSGKLHGSITRTRIPLAGSISQVQEPPCSVAMWRALSRLRPHPGGSDARDR